MYTEMDENNIQTGNPVEDDHVKQLIINQKDLDARVSNVESGGTRVALFNRLYDLDSMPRVGEIKLTMLTVAQFNERYGVDYEKIKGQDITGKDLAAILGSNANKDLRGRFLRDFDELNGSNPDATALLGTQESAVQSHNHPIIAGGNGTHNSGKSTHTQFDTTQFIAPNDWYQYKNTVASAGSVPMIGNTGGAETRPKSLVVNHMVRVNDINKDYFDVTKVFSNLRITSARISILEAGTSGNVEIDILKGDTLDNMTSMLNTTLKASAVEGNYYTSDEADFENNQLTQNQFVRIKLNSVQQNLSRFFLSVYAEPQ